MRITNKENISGRNQQSGMKREEGSFSKNPSPHKDSPASRTSKESSGLPNPAEIEKSLKGIIFPAEKNDLIEKANDNQASEKILDVLKKFEESTFNSLMDISKEMHRLSEKNQSESKSVLGSRTDYDDDDDDDEDKTFQRDQTRSGGSTGNSGARSGDR